MRSRTLSKVLFLALVLAALIGVVEVLSNPTISTSAKSAMLAAAGLFFLIVVFLAFARRSPGNHIAALLQEKRVGEACELSGVLLRRYPKDRVVKLNAVAAYFVAGRRDEARAVLEGISPQQLNGRLRAIYDDWKSKLAQTPPSP